MAMLYPPYLEGTIPAQVGDTLRIPYQLNRAQGPADLKGAKIRARIKTVSTNRAVFSQELETDFVDSSTDIYYAIFNLSESLVEKQYYKIQLAFSIENKPAAYYSTVGIFKYTVQPEVTILNFDSIQANGGAFSHVGQYESLDRNEKVKEYKFDVWEDNVLFYSTGWQIHDIKTDKEPTKSQDELILTQFKNNQRYWIQYSVKTINDLECFSPKYSFYYSHLNQESMQEYPFTLLAKLNTQNGSVNLNFCINKENISVITGKYQIIRREIEGDVDTPWTFLESVLIDTGISRDEKKLQIFTDYTVIQGKTYQYGIFQRSEQHASVIGYIIKSENVTVDFEDIFLFDGERQLKIKYDPKISSFKTTLLESKIDTIGGKYPSFFRNGDVGYKEFPLSGLISYHMDDNDAFFVDQRAETPSKDVFNGFNPAEEMRKEREFKLEVLNWLNNGQPKLLRSGPEGNYIIRLMNISLAPNDTLGRRIHTFSGTAYEIAEYSLDNLKKFKFVNQGYKRIKRLYFRTRVLEKNFKWNINPSVYGRFINALAGSRFKLTFQDKTVSEITIGMSGTYNVFIEENNPLIQVSGVNNSVSGNFECGFFNAPKYAIYNSENKEILKYTKALIVRQVVNGSNETLSELSYCNIYRKNIIHIENKSGSYYYAGTSSEITSWFETALYYDGSYYHYYDGQELIQIEDNDLFTVTFNNDSSSISYQGSTVDIQGRMEYNQNDLQGVSITKIDPGVIVEYVKYADIIETEG